MRSNLDYSRDLTLKLLGEFNLLSDFSLFLLIELVNDAAEDFGDLR
jgi:hypothetical protein